MAQAMASMAGLRGSSQALMEGSLQLSGSSRWNGVEARKVALAIPRFGVKANLQPETEVTSRRSALGLVAAGIASGSFVQAVLAVESKPIKIGPPRTPSRGLLGGKYQTIDLNSSLEERNPIKQLPPAQAVARAKKCATDIVNLKSLIDKKAWPRVQTELLPKASLLHHDLKTVISAKPSTEEKTSLEDLTAKLFTSIRKLDRAAKIESAPEADKYYAEFASTLHDVLSKIG